MSDRPQWRKDATAFAYLNWAEDSKDVTGPARAVFWALAKCVDYKTGKRYMYQQAIMDRAGILSRQTCGRAVKELVDRGILEVEKGTKLPGQTKPAPNLYRLMLPEGYVAESNVATSTSATYLRCGEQHSYGEQSSSSSDSIDRHDLDDDVGCPKGLEDSCMWSGFTDGREYCMVCGLERRKENGMDQGGLVGGRRRHVDR